MSRISSSVPPSSVLAMSCSAPSWIHVGARLYRRAFWVALAVARVALVTAADDDGGGGVGVAAGSATVTLTEFSLSPESVSAAAAASR